MEQKKLEDRIGNLYSTFEIEYYKITNIKRDEFYFPAANEQVWACACGTENPITSKVCSNCGIKVEVLAKIIKKDYLQRVKNELEILEMAKQTVNAIPSEGHASDDEEVSKKSVSKESHIVNTNNETIVERKKNSKKWIFIVAAAFVLVVVAIVMFSSRTSENDKDSSPEVVQNSSSPSSSELEQDDNQKIDQQEQTDVEKEVLNYVSRFCMEKDSNREETESWFENRYYKLDSFLVEGTDRIKDLIVGDWVFYGYTDFKGELISVRENGTVIDYATKKKLFNWDIKNNRLITKWGDMDKIMYGKKMKNDVYSVDNGDVLIFYTDKSHLFNRRDVQFIFTKSGYQFPTPYYEKPDQEIMDRLRGPEKKDPEIGMTAEQVKKSTWGSPEEINTTETTYGKHEQWVYSNHRYIYLDDGIVTGIQKSD